MAATPTTFFRGATNGDIATLASVYSINTTSMVVTNVTVTNSSASSKKITVTLPAGASDIPILSQAVVNANDTVSFDMKQPVTIAGGNAIKASSDSASVFLHIAGVVIT